jgi:hypothetical protein
MTSTGTSSRPRGSPGKCTCTSASREPSGSGCTCCSRDYLRCSADAREAYAAAKREAARLWGSDRPAYTEAKTDVILGILDQAEAWATATGWGIVG